MEPRPLTDMATHSMQNRFSSPADFMQSAPWPVFEADEVKAAERVLISGRVNYWTGQEGREFEREFATSVGQKHAIAYSNGTVSLEAAYRALGLKAGDEFVTTPRTFVATSLAGTIFGAVPIFADVEPNGGNITAESIERVLTPKTKLISLVHLGGWPAEMDEIRQLADSKGIAIVEDCAQAHQAEYKGKPLGQHSEIASWSFCQDKIMTTAGEGGMLATSSDEYAESCWSFKDHGKSRAKMAAPHDGTGYRWVHEGQGTNARMTEVQSAIGRIQLAKLPDWNAKRTKNAETLISGLREISALRVPIPPAHVKAAWYKFYCYVRPEALKDGWSRDRILAAVTSMGVPAFYGSCSEIYREESMKRFAPAAALPVAQELGETTIMLLVHPTLTAAHLQATLEAVSAVMEQATR